MTFPRSHKLGGNAHIWKCTNFQQGEVNGRPVKHYDWQCECGATKTETVKA